MLDVSGTPGTGGAAGVAGLVLAAGGSTRWGEGSKLTAPYRGEALVVGAIRSAREAGLSPIFVVVGHRSDELADLLPGGVVTVANPAWREGRGSSVAAGIEAASREEGVAAVALLLGDEPEVSPAVIRSAVAAWRDEGAELVRTVYRDRPGHPVIFDRARFADLSELGGTTCVRRYLERHPDAVRELAVDAEGPADVDTREDHRRLTAGGEDLEELEGRDR